MQLGAADSRADRMELLGASAQQQLRLTYMLGAGSPSSSATVVGRE